MVAIPPAEPLHAPRALPEVRKDWVQDDAYSSSDVYWLAYEGRTSMVTRRLRKLLVDGSWDAERIVEDVESVA